MSNLPPWAIRTLEAFKFVHEYETGNILAFGNGLLVVGMPEPLLWIAHNDNGVGK